MYTLIQCTCGQVLYIHCLLPCSNCKLIHCYTQPPTADTENKWSVLHLQLSNCFSLVYCLPYSNPRLGPVVRRLNFDLNLLRQHTFLAEFKHYSSHTITSLSHCNIFSPREALAIVSNQENRNFHVKFIFDETHTNAGRV